MFEDSTRRVIEDAFIRVGSHDISERFAVFLNARRGFSLWRALFTNVLCQSP